MIIFSIVMLMLLLAVAIWVVLTYNRLVVMRDHLYEQWAAVDRLFEKRRRLVMRLSDMIRQGMPNESANLDLCVQRSDNAFGAHNASVVEPLLMKTFEQALTRARRHSDLVKISDLNDMDTGSSKLDAQIRAAAKAYNKAAAAANERLDRFPLKLVAIPLGFNKADLYAKVGTSARTNENGFRAEA